MDSRRVEFRVQAPRWWVWFGGFLAAGSGLLLIAQLALLPQGVAPLPFLISLVLFLGSAFFVRSLWRVRHLPAAVVVVDDQVVELEGPFGVSHSLKLSEIVDVHASGDGDAGEMTFVLVDGRHIVFSVASGAVQRRVVALVRERCAGRQR